MVRWRVMKHWKIASNGSNEWSGFLRLRGLCAGSSARRNSVSAAEASAAVSALSLKSRTRPERTFPSEETWAFLEKYGKVNSHPQPLCQLCVLWSLHQMLPGWFPQLEVTWSNKGTGGYCTHHTGFQLNSWKLHLIAVWQQHGGFSLLGMLCQRWAKASF